MTWLTFHKDYRVAFWKMDFSATGIVGYPMESYYKALGKRPCWLARFQNGRSRGQGMGPFPLFSKL